MNSADWNTLVEHRIVGSVEVIDGRAVIGRYDLHFSPRQVRAAAELGVNLSGCDEALLADRAAAPTTPLSNVDGWAAVQDEGLLPEKIEMYEGRYVMAANVEGGLDEFFFPPRIQRAARERLGIELRGVVDAVIEDEQLLAELLARLSGTSSGRLGG